MKKNTRAALSVQSSALKIPLELAHRRELLMLESPLFGVMNHFWSSLKVQLLVYLAYVYVPLYNVDLSVNTKTEM